MQEPSNKLPLMHQYQTWVGQWVLTEPEAQQLQFLAQAALVGPGLESPPGVVQALQKLALHGLVDVETATRH